MGGREVTGKASEGQGWWWTARTQLLLVPWLDVATIMPIKTNKIRVEENRQTRRLKIAKTSAGLVSIATCFLTLFLKGFGETLLPRKLGIDRVVTLLNLSPGKDDAGVKGSRCQAP